MNEKDEIAKLKADLAQSRKETEAARGSGIRLREDSAKLRAVLQAKRDKLKADTHKEGGFAHYFIPDSGQMFYRRGVNHQPGTVVKLPLDEEPSHTWEPVEKETPKATFAPKAPEFSGSGHRPQDRQL